MGKHYTAHETAELRETSVTEPVLLTVSYSERQLSREREILRTKFLILAKKKMCTTFSNTENKF